MKKIEKRLDDVKDDLKKIIKKRDKQYKDTKKFWGTLGNCVAGIGGFILALNLGFIPGVIMSAFFWDYT